MPPAAVQSLYKNRILASLPAIEIRRLAPYLSAVTLNGDQTLHAKGELVELVYFLEEGISSTVVTVATGKSVEVSLTGREGFVGLPAVLGAGRSPNRTFMQLAGRGFAVKARNLVQQFETSRELRLRLLRSVQGHDLQASQTAACNRHHKLTKRLARWLLRCQDRTQSSHLPIKQESLAMALGTRRSTVSGAAGALQEAGLISYARGHVIILKRPALVEAACECYLIVRDEYVRLGLLEE
jgi:CRP-like cAMP-binding protein